MNFNERQEDIGKLEQELIKYGESKQYIMQLKLGYVEMINELNDMNTVGDVMNSYYDHLLNIAKVKYYGELSDYWKEQIK